MSSRTDTGTIELLLLLLLLNTCGDCDCGTSRSYIRSTAEDVKQIREMLEKREAKP